MDLGSAMTEKEAECFRIARWRQRRQLLDELKRQLHPSYPLFEKASKATSFSRTYLLYMLAIFSWPIYFILWPASLAISVARFPFRLISSYQIPKDARGPGERNIRGIHNAFAPHMDLAPENYIACIDDWVRILYGDESAKSHKMSKYVDETLLHLSRFGSCRADDPLLQHLRSSVAVAREKISLDLGCYRS